MLPLFYSSSFSPSLRVGRFVADEVRLGWLFKFLQAVPRAEVYIVGGTARDAVRGVFPKGFHVVVRNVPLVDLNTILRKFGFTDPKDEASLWFRPEGYRQDEAIEVSIPCDGGPEPYAPITFDLGRRDFTMNAMAYSLNSGLLIDPFGGVRDLSNRQISTVGRPEARFNDDPRRALRALRLASEHRYGIEGATWKSLQKTLPKLNRIISAEDGSAVYATPRTHIGHEFLRTLSGQPKYGFQLWRESGANKLFTPELENLVDLRHRGGDNGLMRAERAFDDLGHPLPTLVFATLLSHLEDTALSAARDIIVRLHLHAAHPHFSHSNALWMLEHKNILEEAEPEHMPASLFEHIFGHDRGQHLLTFLHATHRASGRHSKTRDRLHAATVRRQELVTDIKKPALLRGRDLETLGVTPGPKYRKILAKLRDAQLDGHIDNHEEALNYVRNLLSTQTI